MSIVKGADALEVLRDRLAEEGEVADFNLRGTWLPEGFEAVEPRAWLWRESDISETVPALRNPRAYTWTAQVANLIHRTTDDVVDNPKTREDAITEHYCRHSVDLTMRGGTTSGVVYPLAVCEVARRYRLRNVGGASAGAIGAAAAAAAEAGRAKMDADGSRPAPLTEAQVRNGHVRQGFVGLADCLAWLAELDSEHPTGEFRLAQLFRPTRITLPLYRIAVAAMRKRWFGLLASIGGMLSLPFAGIAWVATILTVLLVATVAEDGGWPGWAAWGQAIIGMVGVILLLSGAVAGFIGVRNALPKPDEIDPELVEPVTAPELARKRTGALVFGAAALLIGAALVASAIATADLGWFRFAVVLVGAVVTYAVAVIGIHAVQLYAIVSNKASAGKYGLIAGSTDESVMRDAKHRFWNRVAGVAPHTVTDDLVPWLSRTLAELAGLEAGAVLTFGHLWWGADWDGNTTDEKAPRNPRARLVNLELMTTELVHGRPYRFPLPPTRDHHDADETMYLRKSDLVEAFPPAVVAALTTGERHVLYLVPTGEEIDDLYPLPDPWDLPIVFAVRMSMALPGLFQAVRMYRTVGRTLVREDFGREVRPTEPGAPDLEYPAGARDWVEQLWFTDGGITSNFPIHFFDAPLPLWPTFGISLGNHPRGYRHQDVWLPTDWQAHSSPPQPLSTSFTSFVGAIVTTARSWRDTTQTFMPGFRGRIATVRQGKGEGGQNLFMRREDIAALALRGAFAGARLRRRFDNDLHWRRHQWLRLRVAFANLDALSRRVGTALRQPSYVRLYSEQGGAAFDRLKLEIRNAGGDADLPRPDEWSAPQDRDKFWAAAHALATVYATELPFDAGELSRDSPRPSPDLRQVPPI